MQYQDVYDHVHASRQARLAALPPQAFSAAVSTKTCPLCSKTLESRPNARQPELGHEHHCACGFSITD